MKNLVSPGKVITKVLEGKISKQKYFSWKQKILLRQRKEQHHKTNLDRILITYGTLLSKERLCKMLGLEVNWIFFRV